MAFESPSERFVKNVKLGTQKFFFLKSIEGIGLARTIWIMTLVFYGWQFLMAVMGMAFTIAAFWSAIASGGQSSGLFEFWLFKFYSLLSPLSWILMVRLALEVCLRLLDVARHLELQGGKPDISGSLSEN